MIVRACGRVRAHVCVCVCGAVWWLELANGAFYVIGFAVFRYMEYHCTTKVRRETCLLFFQC
jgi:hypothetical protein